MTSLFEKLGGRDAVNASVDIFYKKVLADPQINHFFENVEMKRQIAKQKAFLTYAFGGAPNYSDKTMREAHQHLSLEEVHFQLVAGHLKSILEELNVPIR